MKQDKVDQGRDQGWTVAHGKNVQVHLKLF